MGLIGEASHKYEGAIANPERKRRAAARKARSLTFGVRNSLQRNARVVALIVVIYRAQRENQIFDFGAFGNRKQNREIGLGAR